MRASLRGCELKIERALDHLNEYRDRAVTWTEGDVLFTREEPQSDDWWIYFGKLKEEPPLKLGIIIGDFAHNLRSALDQLVWQLVIANGKNPQQGTTGFPIETTEAGWCQRVEPRRATDRKSKRILKGVSERCLARIKELQPFDPKRPEAESLRLLARLNNFDKHRTLHTGIIGLSGLPTDIRIEPPGLVYVAEHVLGPRDPLKVGAEVELLRVRYAPFDPEADVDVQPHFRIGVATRIGPDHLSVARLRAVLCDVSRVIADLWSLK